jgi:hypothetical protein
MHSRRSYFVVEGAGAGVILSAGAILSVLGVVVGVVVFLASGPQPMTATTPKLQTNINIAANFFISTPFENLNGTSVSRRGTLPRSTTIKETSRPQFIPMPGEKTIE